MKEKIDHAFIVDEIKSLEGIDNNHHLKAASKREQPANKCEDYLA